MKIRLLLIISVWLCASTKIVAQDTNKDDQRAVAVGAISTNAIPGNEAQSKRVALIIGNGSYVNLTPLKNSVNDATSMSDSLRGFGFKVYEALDLTNNQMQQVVNEFENALQEADVGLFFFAGHGAQVKGTNYLIPVKTTIHSESDVEKFGLSANRVLSAMERSGVATSIIILDACRNNPFESASRSMTMSNEGLARMDAPTGSIVIYATAPGKTASDGAGSNGLFTGHLLKNMQKQGKSINEIAIATRRGVIADSKGAQVPWELSSLVDQFYFQPSSTQQQIAAFNEQAQSAANPDTAPLNVFAKPTTAKVTLLDAAAEYSPGVVLPIGQYRIQVSADGYETMTRTVDLAVQNAYEFVLGPTLTDEQFAVDQVVFNMKAIAGGEYTMGCTRQKDCPSRKNITQNVYIDGFRIMETETTWGLYELCLAEGVCSTVSPESNYYVNTMPVSGVPYLEITEAFIPWLEYKTGQRFRLPTESEWEYAYKAKRNLDINLNSANACRLVNFAGGRHRCAKDPKIKAVKKYRANDFGLYDMQGNVAELTADCYTRDITDVPLDGSAQTLGNCDRRVVRGGAFDDNFRDADPYNRDSVNVEHSIESVGFRLVQSASMVAG